ncbi:MAG: T9SS type A sorting domain-containing protein, partial [Candidatus Edwardsbacteria bacterium]|nr:T9SS type A sorting domain-containing protein [Candidatus Edwardsbacteria bacterium]
TNGTTTVAAGNAPNAVAVNPVTNKIYVANRSSNNVTVIDGATNGTTTVAAGNAPNAVAVNPVTNKIYVANRSSNNVTVIDGVTNDTIIVAAGTAPYAVSCNPVTNKIFVPNVYSANVTVIDGATNTTASVAAGDSSHAVAVNPVTNKIYVANGSSANVTVIDEAPVYDTGVRAVINPLANNSTYLSQPTLAGKAVNRWPAGKTDMMGVINDCLPCPNSWQWSAGPFDSTSSDSIGFNFNWGDSLIWGENFVTFVPLEMQAATSNNLGLGTPFAGNMLVYPVYRIDSTAYYGVGGQPADGGKPLVLRLEQNWPNPMKDRTTIRYQLSKSTAVKVEIYNVAGQRVKTLVQGIQPAGYHTVQWNAIGVSAGVYFYRLQTGEFSSTKKLMIVR